MCLFSSKVLPQINISYAAAPLKPAEIHGVTFMDTSSEHSICLFSIWRAASELLATLSSPPLLLNISTASGFCLKFVRLREKSAKTYNASVQL